MVWTLSVFMELILITILVLGALWAGLAIYEFIKLRDEDTYQ